MTNNLLAAADDMIQEYCIYRGFVNSFRVIEHERTLDKTKSFEANLIVAQIWDYLDNGTGPLVIYYQYILNNSYL